MIDVLKWYLFIQVLGLINLPLTWSVFQRLQIAWSLSCQAHGLAALGFCLLVDDIA